MISIPNPGYNEDNDDDTPEYLNLVSHKIVCPTCNGKGKHSNRLGAFTSDEWAQQSDEFKEDYFGGLYDDICEECKGENVIDEVTPQLNSQELLDIYNEYMTEMWRDKEIARQEDMYTSGDYFGGY